MANFPNKDLKDDAVIETLDRTLARVLNVIENTDADRASLGQEYGTPEPIDADAYVAPGEWQCSRN